MNYTRLISKSITHSGSMWQRLPSILSNVHGTRYGAIPVRHICSGSDTGWILLMISTTGALSTRHGHLISDDHPWSNKYEYC